MSADEQPVTYILGASCIGPAVCNDDGTTTIPIDLRAWSQPVYVYVRRSSADLSLFEVHMARHDGLAQEELDRQNEEAEHHPLGVKEYWRGEMVGKYTYGRDGHLMTDADFESDWAEDEEEGS